MQCSSMPDGNKKYMSIGLVNKLNCHFIFEYTQPSSDRMLFVTGFRKVSGDFVVTDALFY